MSKLLMVAGGIVEPGGGQPGAVSAYVVLSASRASTRIFKVRGPTNHVDVHELPAAITVDLGRFQTELHSDLEPVVRDIQARGGQAGVSTPAPAWVCGIVGSHLKLTEGWMSTADVSHAAGAPQKVSARRGRGRTATLRADVHYLMRSRTSSRARPFAYLRGAMTAGPFDFALSTHQRCKLVTSKWGKRNSPQSFRRAQARWSSDGR